MDGPMFAAMTRQAEAAEWTTLHELAALQAELVHGVLRCLIQTGGGKPPEPLQIPRPRRAGEDRPRMISPGVLAGMIAHQKQVAQ